MVSSTSDDPGASPWVRDAIERSLTTRRERVLSRGERIVAVVVELLGEVGDQFSIDDIVKRSGVARRTFAQAFDGKDDVTLAALETITDPRFRDQAAALTACEGDPVAQLHAVLAVRWRWPDDLPLPMARAMSTVYPKLRSRLPEQILASRRKTDHHTALALANLRAAGMLRDGTLDDEALAELIGTLLAALLHNRVLSVPDELDAMPPDEAGFAPFWEFVTAAVLRDDIRRPAGLT